MEIRFNWPKIYDSVLFEVASGEKSAQIAAREIEGAIKQECRTPGSLFGTSPELCERFGVGRETLLEATRLLEDRGVARMRRGPRGGLIFPCAAAVQRDDDSQSLSFRTQPLGRTDKRGARRARVDQPT